MKNTKIFQLNDSDNESMGLLKTDESMTIEKTLTGFIVISTIHDGRLVTRRFSGYTKKEAITKFKKLLKED